MRGFGFLASSPVSRGLRAAVAGTGMWRNISSLNEAESTIYRVSRLLNSGAVFEKESKHPVLVVGITLCFVLLVLGLLVLVLHVRVMCEDWCGMCGPDDESAQGADGNGGRRGSESSGVDDSNRSSHPLRGKDASVGRSSSSDSDNNRNSSSTDGDKRGKRRKGDRAARGAKGDDDDMRRSSPQASDSSGMSGGGTSSSNSTNGSTDQTSGSSAGLPVLEYPGQRPLDISAV